MGITAVIAGLAISTAASVGTSIYAAENQPTAPKAPSTQDLAKEQAQAAQAASLAQAQALTKQRGMASTILTSPTGVSGIPTTQKSTLGA